MGHATACWMTCGTVKGIEVYGNEGGVTKYVGGWRWFIIPSGYVGGSFWGCVLYCIKRRSMGKSSGCNSLLCGNGRVHVLLPKSDYGTVKSWVYSSYCWVYFGGSTCHYTVPSVLNIILWGVHWIFLRL